MGLNIWIPPGADNIEKQIRIAKEEALEERDYRRQDYIDGRTKTAEAGRNKPELLLPGHDPSESMSWDYGAGHKDRRKKELREMRAKNIPLRPQARIVHGHDCPCGVLCDKAVGQIENIYTYDEDLEVFAQGLCCINCTNWRADSEDAHYDKHRQLARLTNRPEPKKDFMDEHCATCGGTLNPNSNGKIEIRTKEVA